MQSGNVFKSVARRSELEGSNEDEEEEGSEGEDDPDADKADDACNDERASDAKDDASENDTANVDEEAKEELDDNSDTSDPASASPKPASPLRKDVVSNVPLGGAQSIPSANPTE
ncbi:MAG: hypothetical protein EBT43_06525 [Methylocystaceae bacterium]|nr:hypothetical protein [Methylocystaceae bacterium]